MIIDWLIGLIFALLMGVLGLIPSFTIFDPSNGGELEGNVHNAYSCQAWCPDVAAWLRTWDLFFPVGFLFTCMAAIVAARLLVALVQFLKWVWELIPMKSS